ncbi:hypothetical protein [Paenibacillus senegalensis]|uniref:hypothetical protein n=1 Tax=Paenibacillus senegalensis TaxID=1465766 RepID=UPI000287FDAC|nr:hypothetical protein [Paenibacillus senegalensis]
MKKLTFFISTGVMALLSCYALFWMTRGYIAAIEDRFANPASFEAMGIVAFGAPFFLFFAQALLLSLIYGMSVHGKRSEAMDWKFIAGNKGPRFLNGFKLVLAAFLLFAWWLLFTYDVIPFWCGLVVAITLLCYSVWMLQLIRERLPDK